MNYPFLRRPAGRSFRLLLLGSLIGAISAGALRADDRVAVRAKASPEYAAWKFGSGTVKNESYVFSQGHFYGGATHDAGLEKIPFLDVVKSFARDLVGQHYYPADTLQKANLLITVDWGVTAVAESAAEQTGQTNPVGVADTDSARRESIHQMAVTERASNSPSASVQLMDRSYEATRINGLISDANAQNLDQKSQGLGLEANASLVGFDDDLRADNQSAFGTPQGSLLRGLLTEERYFVALNAYDAQKYLKTKELVLVWSMRLSMRALDTDFRKGVSFMSAAGRASFGHKTDSVEMKTPQIEIGTPTVVQPDAPQSK